MAETIYVKLLDEGVDVWRPVEARHLHDDVYEIVGDNVSGDEEQWEFLTGEKVRCKSHVFADGTSGLVAVVKET